VVVPTKKKAEVVPCEQYSQLAPHRLETAAFSNVDRTMQSESTHLVIHKSCLPTDKARGTFGISTFGISVRSNLDL